MFGKYSREGVNGISAKRTTAAAFVGFRTIRGRTGKTLRL